MAELDAKAVALVYDFLLTKDKNFAEVFQSKFNAVRFCVFFFRQVSAS